MHMMPIEIKIKTRKPKCHAMFDIEEAVEPINGMQN